MNSCIQWLKYHSWASFRRKLLDDCQEKYKDVYSGKVLDVGGRDRGRFQKPKEKVEKWIFADLCPEWNPDIVLDMADMSILETESITTIAAMEVFSHVERIDQALDESFRVLEKGGKLVFSELFTYPVINDPGDYQRYTEAKWRLELTKRGFTVEVVEKMGGFFTVVADFFLVAFKANRVSRLFGMALLPFLMLFAHLDTLPSVRKSKKLSSFTTGYFIIAKK